MDINMLANLSTSHPPPFLKLLSHTQRWRLLLALAQSDLRVMELIERVAQPQNLVSYHLQRLRKEKLVEVRRSGADSREIYYSLNLDEIHRLYIAAGEMLHPALGEAQEDDPLLEALPTLRVLFLCTHNSARSQMAEGILRAVGQGKIEVYSAGTEPAQVHPLAIRAMDEMKIDLRAHRSKALEEFLDQTFDYIITVCDRAREACPVFPGDPTQIHWSFPDPSAVEGAEAVRFEAFRTTAIQLNTRINYLLMMMRRKED
jgi:protein-tyrosine-phosphatase/DNA-binding transcriptional ArsR family regulator